MKGSIKAVTIINEAHTGLVQADQQFINCCALYTALRRAMTEGDLSS